MRSIPPFLRDSGAPTLLKACGIQLDISRQRMTRDDFNALLALAKTRDVLGKYRQMMAGEIVNLSEGRCALHTSLRSYASQGPKLEEIRHERDRFLSFAESIRSGRRLGCRGHRITDVINVGIGGSDLGIRTVYHALREPKMPIRLHFLSAADGIQLERILSECDPKTTLTVVSSKSFKTRETMVNASAIEQWYLDAGIVGSDRRFHVVLVSANPQAAEQMCLPEENLFHSWEWVGGRFSLWGATGLPLAIALGKEKFEQLLKGAQMMDEHARDTEAHENFPLILALMSYWNSTHWSMSSHCLLTYDERLSMMVPWLQQLEMESLGKPAPRPCRLMTGQAVWGGHGNEAQHSFFQWLREGTARSSIDLIWCETPGHRFAEHYRVLLANAQAQAKALVERSDPEFFNALTTLSIDACTQARLGSLLALYDHKTTRLGSLYGLNPFDQPGVELGKKLSLQLEHSK